MLQSIKNFFRFLFGGREEKTTSATSIKDSASEAMSILHQARRDAHDARMMRLSQQLRSPVRKRIIPSKKPKERKEESSYLGAAVAGAAIDAIAESASRRSSSSSSSSSWSSSSSDFGGGGFSGGGGDFGGGGSSSGF